MPAQSEQEKGRILSPSRLSPDPLSPCAPLFLAINSGECLPFFLFSVAQLIRSLSIPETSFSLLCFLSFSLYLVISLSPQGITIFRLSCSGHPLETHASDKSSGGADWSGCISVEANSRRWQRIQRAWPYRGFLVLYRRLQPYPPPVQDPNKFLSTSSS